jgi:hypothetical protein
MAARGFLGAGDVYIERIVAGVSQGLNGPYYANKFEVKPNVEVRELTSKGRNDYGQTLESVALQQPADFTLELKEVNKESIGLALLGSTAAVNYVGSTLTSAPVTTIVNQWVEIGAVNLTGTVTVTDDSATPIPAVEGVDYMLNKQLGLLKAIEGGVLDGADAEVSGTSGAYTGVLISGATTTDIRARIIFDGINQADGLPVIVRAHEVVIAADAAFDFLADDFGNISLPGKMKTPTGKTEPFTVELRNS